MPPLHQNRPRSNSGERGVGKSNNIHSPGSPTPSSSSSPHHHRSTKSTDAHPVPNMFLRPKALQHEVSEPESRASRLLLSVRRTLSGGRKVESDVPLTGMYSTPEESFTPPPLPIRSSSSSRSSSRIRYRHDDDPSRFYPPGSLPPPSVSQIAMGLHMSRTPYLGRAHVQGRYNHNSRGGAGEERETYSEPELVRRHTYFGSPPLLSRTPSRIPKEKVQQPIRPSLKKSALRSSCPAPIGVPSSIHASLTTTSTLSSPTVTSPPSTPRSFTSALGLTPTSANTTSIHESDSNSTTPTNRTKNVFSKFLLPVFRSGSGNGNGNGSHKSLNGLPSSTNTMMMEDSDSGHSGVSGGSAAKKVVRFVGDDE